MGSKATLKRKASSFSLSDAGPRQKPFSGSTDTVNESTDADTIVVDCQSDNSMNRTASSSLSDTSPHECLTGSMETANKGAAGQATKEQQTSSGDGISTAKDISLTLVDLVTQQVNKAVAKYLYEDEAKIMHKIKASFQDTQVAYTKLKTIFKQLNPDLKTLSSGKEEVEAWLKENNARVDSFKASLEELVAAGWNVCIPSRKLAIHMESLEDVVERMETYGLEPKENLPEDLTVTLGGLRLFNGALKPLFEKWGVVH